MNYILSSFDLVTMGDRQLIGETVSQSVVQSLSQSASRRPASAQSVNQSIRQSVSGRAFCVCIAIVQMKVAQT